MFRTNAYKFFLSTKKPNSLQKNLSTEIKAENKNSTMTKVLIVGGVSVAFGTAITSSGTSFAAGFFLGKTYERNRKCRMEEAANVNRDENIRDPGNFLAPWQNQN